MVDVLSPAGSKADVSSPAGSFAFPADHPCFPGHMPGHPLAPGALLLDRALHLLTAHGLLPERHGLVTAKFLAPVGPGDEVTVVGQRSPSGGVSFEGRICGRRVFTGRVLPASPP